jgi:hypothetical protein
LSGKSFGGGKEQRNCAERGEQRPMHSIHYDTHQLVGYEAAPPTSR